MSEPVKVWTVGEYGPEKCWWIRGPVENGYSESTVVGDDGKLRSQWHQGRAANEPPSGYFLAYEDAKADALAQLTVRLAKLPSDYREMLDDQIAKTKDALERLKRER